MWKHIHVGELQVPTQHEGFSAGGDNCATILAVLAHVSALLGFIFGGLKKISIFLLYFHLHLAWKIGLY